SAAPACRASGPSSTTTSPTAGTDVARKSGGVTTVTWGRGRVRSSVSVAGDRVAQTREQSAAPGGGLTDDLGGVAVEPTQLLDELTTLPVEPVRDDDLHVHGEVAGPAAAHPGHALAGQGDRVTGLGAGGDVDLERLPHHGLELHAPAEHGV